MTPLTLKAHTDVILRQTLFACFMQSLLTTLLGLDIVLRLGGCPNYGPCLGTHTTRCCIIKGIQTGTIILTTTHLAFGVVACELRFKVKLSLGKSVF